MRSRLYISFEPFQPIPAPVVFTAADWDRGFG